MDNTKSDVAQSGCRYEMTGQAHNSVIEANEIFEQGYQFHYQHDQQPKPNIAFIRFESGEKNVSMSCGKSQSCPVPTTTTPLTLNTTTETATTLPPLTGDTCDPFVDMDIDDIDVNFIDGNIKIRVPKDTDQWILTVSL